MEWRQSPRVKGVPLEEFVAEGGLGGLPKVVSGKHVATAKKSANATLYFFEYLSTGEVWRSRSIVDPEGTLASIHRSDIHRVSGRELTGVVSIGKTISDPSLAV